MVLFLIAFVLLLVIGVPISISIGASAVLGCLSLGYPLAVSYTHLTLPTIA